MYGWFHGMYGWWFIGTLFKNRCEFSWRKELRVEIEILSPSPSSNDKHACEQKRKKKKEKS